MGGGGKGGQETTEVKIPPSLELYAKDVMNMSMTAATQPYQPNRGMRVAGVTPQQMAAYQGANQAAKAYGMPSTSTQAVRDTTAKADMQQGGIRGHSTAGLYDVNLTSTYTPAFRQERGRLYTSPRTGEARNPRDSGMYEARYGGTDPNNPLSVGPDPRTGGGGK